MNDIANKNKKHAAILSGPLQIQFDITNKCNFRCLHCYNESGENLVCSNELTDIQIMKLFIEIKAFKPYSICFCGGEPMLRYRLIRKILRFLNHEIPNVAIVSNGYLWDEEKIKEMTSLGLNRIQFSLDGITKETYEKLRVKEGSYEHVINAIKLCSKYKRNIKELMLSFAPTSFNISEFPILIDEMMKYVDTIRIQPLMLSGRAKKNLDIQPKNYQYIQLHKYLTVAKEKYGEKKIEWGDPSDHLIRFRKYLNDLNTNLTILADGSLVASPYIPISFGNVKKHSLKDYWKSGLVNIWNNPVIQDYSSKMNLISDIGEHVDGYPVLWEEENLMIDIMEKKAQ